MEKDLKTEEFIKKAIEIHGDKYDYSEVYYESSKKKIIIICKIHGKFEKRASAHIGTQKHGCKKCSIESRLLTLDFFLEKSKEVHGDKYDYSLVEYINVTTKVKIICKEHGEFEQTPSDHLRSYGCVKCAIIIRSNKTRLSDIEFVKKAIEVHGDKYDYSLVEYINMNSKVKILCKEHGIFEQKANNHLTNHGCSKCVGNKKSNNIEFIKKSKEVHGDKYDYSFVEYINTNTKVKIKCKEHGIFEQLAYSHLAGSGCAKCSGKNKTIDDFIKNAKEVHGDKFDYSLATEYKPNREKMTVICKKHGAFGVTYDHHINRGQGCPKCKSLNLDGFIEKANKVHDNKYDYSKSIYINNKEKIDIICPIHGLFNQRVSDHINGKSGCPDCSDFNSKGEKEIKEYLNKNNIIFEAQKRFEDCRYINPLPFDFYLPEHNICIEFNGRQHYEYVYYFHRDYDGFKIQKLKDKIKIEYCDFYFIKLITIKYDEDIEKILNESIF